MPGSARSTLGRSGVQLVEPSLELSHFPREPSPHRPSVSEPPFFLTRASSLLVTIVLDRILASMPHAPDSAPVLPLRASLDVTGIVTTAHDSQLGTRLLAQGKSTVKRSTYRHVPASLSPLLFTTFPPICISKSVERRSSRAHLVSRFRSIVFAALVGQYLIIRDRLDLPWVNYQR